MATTYIPESIISNIKFYIDDIDTLCNFRLVNKINRRVCNDKLSINADKLIKSSDNDNYKFKWIMKFVEIALNTSNHDTLCHMELMFYNIVTKTKIYIVTETETYIETQNILIKFIKLLYNNIYWLYNEINNFDDMYYIPNNINVEFTFNSNYMYYMITIKIIIDNYYDITMYISTVDITYNTTGDTIIYNKYDIYDRLMLKNIKTNKIYKYTSIIKNIFDYNLYFIKKPIQVDKYEFYDDFYVK
jgi:hypothetical protein